MKSKLRIRKAEDGGVYAVKTSKMISPEEARKISEKRDQIKEIKIQKKELLKECK